MASKFKTRPCMLWGGKGMVDFSFFICGIVRVEALNSVGSFRVELKLFNKIDCFIFAVTLVLRSIKRGLLLVLWLIIVIKFW